VQFPKPKPASQPGANPDEQSDSPPTGQEPQPGQAPANVQPPPADASQPGTAKLLGSQTAGAS